MRQDELPACPLCGNEVVREIKYLNEHDGGSTLHCLEPDCPYCLSSHAVDGRTWTIEEVMSILHEAHLKLCAAVRSMKDEHPRHIAMKSDRVCGVSGCTRIMSEYSLRGMCDVCHSALLEG